MFRFLFSIPSSGRTKRLNCRVQRSCPAIVLALLTRGLHTRTTTLYIFKNTNKYGGTIGRNGFLILQLSPSFISLIWFFQFRPSKTDGASHSKGNDGRGHSLLRLKPSFQTLIFKITYFSKFFKISTFRPLFRFLLQDGTKGITTRSERTMYLRPFIFQNFEFSTSCFDSSFSTNQRAVCRPRFSKLAQ
jgi:hypothetical protein